MFLFLCFASFVVGCALMREGLVGLGLLVWIAGPIVIFVISCFVYGFGEVVDTAIILRHREEQNGRYPAEGDKKPAQSKKYPYKDIVRCAQQPAGICAGCKQMKAEIWQCIIKNGIRYAEKNMCQQCIDSFIVR